MKQKKAGPFKERMLLCEIAIYASDQEAGPFKERMVRLPQLPTAWEECVEKHLGAENYKQD
jgi:hypothetical protein